METSLNDTKFEDEVRDAMAGIDASKIPADTILQQRDRFCEPVVNKQSNRELTQDEFDTAVIAFTAERSFKSWLSKRRMADADLQVSAKPTQLKKDLEERANEIFALFDISRPRSSNRPLYHTSTHDDT